MFRNGESQRSECWRNLLLLGEHLLTFLQEVLFIRNILVLEDAVCIKIVFRKWVKFFFANFDHCSGNVYRSPVYDMRVWL